MAFGTIHEHSSEYMNNLDCNDRTAIMICARAGNFPRIFQEFSENKIYIKKIRKKLEKILVIFCIYLQFFF